MKISINWIKNYLNLPDQKDWDAFGDLLTVRTAEVEEVIDLAKSFDHMVIGQIDEIRPHPNADKLKITITNIGSTTHQIICGGSNIFVGQKVAVALPGAKVKWHGEGDLIELQASKIRGEESFGMICAGSEIGMKDDIEGEILDLTHLKYLPGTPLAEALNKNDIIIDIENKTLTHRPDLWGHYGMAREIAAITDQKLKSIEYFEKYNSKLPNIIDIDVKEPKLCPRYLSVTLDNIKVEESPDWLKTALENTGNKSINNIVDATNFVMLELGNPLHAFDTKQIEGEKIIVRKAKTGEIITTLDNEEKKLDKDVLIIADNKKPLAIAGIKGGLHSGINSKTKTITLEAANFEPISIRKSSVKLGIRTDSVQRFEKSLDPLLAEKALDRLVKIILDLCPSAKIISKKQDINNFKYQPKVIKFDLDKANQKIGIEIDKKTAKDLLEKLEFKIETLKGNILNVTVPSFRATKDINLPEDLTEELARLYGYEKIKPVIPELSIRTIPRPNNELKEEHLIKDILSLELGFNETINYSFYSLKTIENSNLNHDDHITICNHLSEEQTHLRTNLIPSLLLNAKENLKNFSEFKLFESGRTYKLANSFFPIEEKFFAGIIVLNDKSKTEPFYKIKTAIEILLNRLNINSLKYQKSQIDNPLSHPNQSATYFDFKTQKEIINIFTLHPQVAHNFNFKKEKIACFTLNFSALHQLPHPPRKYKNIAKFPSITFDISLIIDKNQEIANIEKTIYKADNNLITKIELFDFYQGENIPKDKKSLAFHITLQSDNRTLQDEDMKNIQNNIVKNLEKLNAEIR